MNKYDGLLLLDDDDRTDCYMVLHDFFVEELAQAEEALDQERYLNAVREYRAFRAWEYTMLEKNAQHLENKGIERIRGSLSQLKKGKARCRRPISRETQKEDN